MLRAVFECFGGRRLGSRRMWVWGEEGRFFVSLFAHWLLHKRGQHVDL